MNKSFKNLVIGAVSGVAAAYFLSTEKGKALKNRAEKAYQAYKESPDDYHQLAKEKGSEYSHLARDTFYDVKDKLASGDLTKEDMLDLLKDKTTAFVQKTKETLAEVEAKEKQDDVIIDLNEEDIIIDYTEQDEPVSDTLDKH
ncbi:gas vesicle protein [Streptococcus pyogenes]|uniref:YtxH domain-containing protein n=1 Tax=Streptococcus pyogenes TaxID=1314 RepID=UPI00109C7112|nr:YtxH domain-containing protein [Streptococcus pyogenes]VGV31650.1 gas vesicle protein [Streptococcus pyogenes]VGV69505.1 gas vesicle protein [Streptococcus pyogenes]VGV86167.1 gas vesicle protein [Streptococcus pyogenes]VHA71370.1 gas vesicle protein [Streptococcus pyogenes]VHC47443.1 gas vesicle protein [Streptococcus pyogenes]